MAFKDDTTTLATSINEVLDKKRKPFFIGFIVIVAAIVFASIAIVIKENNTAKNLEKIDLISYELRIDASGLSTEEVEARRADALAKLAPFTEKSDIAGARAALLVAELNFQKDNFAEARDYYLKAAKARKNAYFVPNCFFNAAVCSENLGDNAKALEYYTKATEYSEYLLVDHAMFNVGRLNEANGDIAAATAAYEKLNDAHPSSNWAKLANSRILALKIAGK